MYTMENIDKIKQTTLFKNVTQKDDAYINFLHGRVSSHIPPTVATQMVEFALSKEHNNLALKQIDTECFRGKSPEKSPTINIVISQTGGGKTGVTANILKQNPNTIFIDTDIFKKYNPLKDLILEFCPTYFGHLTGLDCYLHRDYIYEKAIENNYNILIEVTPSTSQKLFNIDLEKLHQKGYKICAHILAVSKINSLISVHERYENQLDSGTQIPKLTDLNRALDSVDATEQTLVDLLKLNYVNVKLYFRDDLNQVKIDTQNKKATLNRFRLLRQNDQIFTLKTCQNRISILQQKMEKRNANLEQKNQLNKIVEIINKIK